MESGWPDENRVAVEGTGTRRLKREGLAGNPGGLEGIRSLRKERDEATGHSIEPF